VEAVCQAQTIATNHTLRKACRAAMEKYEDGVVNLYYKHALSMRSGDEDDDSLGGKLCGRAGVVDAGCEDEVAALSIRELLAIEEVARLVDRDETHPAYRAPNTAQKYRSEPEEDKERRGVVSRITASDFYKRVIIDRKRDALVYFAYPSLAPEFDFAYEQTHAIVAEYMEDTDLLVGTLNAELNDVPPPYNSWAKTPNVLLYLANRKENPRWIPLRTAAGEYMTGDSAPTLADVLTMISKRSENTATKKAADFGLIDATAEQLHSSRGRTKTDEL
jgi:hypothetical protein